LEDFKKFKLPILFGRFKGGSTSLHLKIPQKSTKQVKIPRKFDLELHLNTLLTHQTTLENSLQLRRYKIPKLPFEIARAADPCSLKNLFKNHKKSKNCFDFFS